MGEIRPIPDNSVKVDNIKSGGNGWRGLSDVYLAKDGSRTEQLNTANAIIAAHLCMIDEPRPDLHSKEECEQAVLTYFKNCALKNVRPSLAGICLSMGTTRRDFINACESGVLTPKGTTNTVALPNDVWQFMVSLRNNYAAMIESFLETNMIHPSAGIFLLKANCGYQEEVTHNINFTHTKVDLSAFANKYAEELGQISDENGVEKS